jgi:hypothetical protein
MLSTGMVDEQHAPGENEKKPRRNWCLLVTTAPNLHLRLPGGAAGARDVLGHLLPCLHALKVCVLPQATSIQPVRMVEQRVPVQLQPMQVTQVVQQPIVEQVHWEPVVQQQVVEHVQWEPVQEVRAPALLVPSSVLPGCGYEPSLRPLATPVAWHNCNPVTS